MTKSEAQTRAELIDKLLGNSGWNVKDPTQVVEELDIITQLPEGISEPRTPYEGRQFADYVLLGKDGKPLAVIEAKKTSKDAPIGREQAKQYCYNIQKQLGCELPFCFYTNGLETYFWDLENAAPRKVVGYPTRDDLERFAYIRRSRKPLTQEFINTSIAGRDYQIRAIRAVLEGIEQKKRDFLLVMATGTGKTRTCIAMVDALMRAGHAEKVLFLVDRIALREQALSAFKEHMPNEPRWPNVGEKLIAKDRRVYVATYPTMLNIIRDESQSLSPHFFDFIVVDESHRSIYNTYGEVLYYFKTITLSLTATPTDIIDHNTFRLFHCENGLPTFAYTFEEAVNNVPPYLCNFQVMKIQTKFQMEGISKRTISLDDQKKLILQGKEVEEINFEGSQLEKQVINKGTNTLIVREFMEESIKDANGVLPGKTIFFCATKAHARRMEEIFDKLYPQYHGELAKVLVSDDPRVYGKGGLLDQFTNNDMPRIAISVDMLDTGIDVREIVNLVFAKPVYSYTKFWQMVGRGTRLLETSKPKPWCIDKKQKYYIGEMPQEYILNRDELLLAMTEQAPGLLGSSLIVPKENLYLHNQRLGLVVGREPIQSRFIFHLFNQQSIRQVIHSKATGTKVRHTSPSKIESIVVGYPPIDLQNQFAAIVEKVESIKSSYQQSLTDLEALYGTLSQQAFKGDLDLSRVHLTTEFEP